MKRELFIFLATITFIAAMVPKHRRATHLEDEEAFLKSQSMAAPSEKTREICAPQTPCAWSIYKPRQTITDFITNTYCDCGAGTTCQVHEDDKEASALVHRCRPPVDNDHAAES